MLKKLFILLSFSVGLFLFCCKRFPELPYVSYPSTHPKKKVQLTENELKDWYHKDIVDDTIPGISLEKAYDLLLKDKKGKEIIIAVIDMEVDIEHKDLHDQIWINDKEIPNNNIDDDDNGYVDDIHGWNFLGNNRGENLNFMKYEYTRIINKYDSLFKDRDISHISLDKRKLFLDYTRAKKKYKERMEYALEAKRNSDLLYDGYYLAKKELAQYFPSENYTLDKLDSLKNTSVDTIMKGHITLLFDCIKYNMTENYIKEYKLHADERINKLLNLSYNDREILGDDPNNISDTKYGNNRVSAHTTFLDHGTITSGIIAATRSNNTGIKGFSDNFKIMPLCTSSYGDEHDKDIALAIKYAVDNGAKVINMSFGKEFSMHKNWVDNAIKYAEENNVLIVTSAGNDGYNLDKEEFFNYPDDSDNNGIELVQNFIKVGESGYTLDEKLISSESNYGKKSIDVFAPGTNIYTTSTKPEKYEVVNGTSFSSAMVSGIAALLFSYFPNLTASQVKKIILESGVSYDIDCTISGNEDGKKQPFTEFSKSGKIVNAYNALLMAEREFSK
ncbi:S8 family serine peptidase [Sinomicrobium sp. M5D2P9]